MKNKSPRTTRPLFLIVLQLPHLIARESRTSDLINHLRHQLVVRLTRDLQKGRPGRDSGFAADVSQLHRNIVEGKSLGYRGPGLAELGGDLLMGVEKLLSQSLKAIRFFERTQVAALKVFDKTDLEDSPLLNGRNKVGHIAKGPTRLIRVGNQFIERDHPPDRSALT